MILSIAGLPFRERPVHELLALDREADPEYAGFGWARVDRLWLASDDEREPQCVDDALVIAVHASDDAEAIADDVDLDFEVDDEVVASVLASTFLAVWLPRLPQDTKTIVLVMCNPHAARLVTPPSLDRPLHHGLGDVYAWFDPDAEDGAEHGGRIRLVAEAWRTLKPVSTELEVHRPNTAITDEQRLAYVGLYLLKKLDLKPADGGMTFPIVLSSELGALEEVLHHLAIEGHVEMNTKKDRYDITKPGLAYLGRVIDEATDLIDEFDEDEMPEVVEELRKRRLDPMRARFLWGWYDGEFDDLVLWQEQRGIKPVERMWAFYLMGDDFWNELARELEGD